MQPSPKPLKRWGLSLLLALAVAACNMFNPSGEGDVGEDADALLTLGESKFRDQDYPASMDAYSRVIAKDSGNSLAYYGYAKAVMRYWQVSAATLLTEVTKAQEKSGIPFITADDWTTTRYLQATSKTRKALSMLTVRDTLTRWFHYAQDSTSKSARKDPDRDKRIAFIRNYWDMADRGFPGYRKKSQFPLSDLTIGYERIIADFGFVELIYAVTHLRDLNADDSITDADNLLKKLNFNVLAGGFKVENLQNIAEDIKSDSTRANVNNLIQNVASGLSSAGNVIDLLGPILAQNGDSSGGGSLTGKTSEKMDSVISSIGNAVTFYQFGDAKDNDGDGCIDEEILDGKDNDDDGFTDEDARVIPADTVDNDHNGKGKNPFLDPDNNEQVNGDYLLLFSVQSGFVKGRSYKDKTVKVWVQKDSLATKATLNASEKVVLDSAKRAIGGCWNNY